MSKRSRAERRQGQLDRAVRHGDLTAIEALVNASPEKAATALIQAAAAPGIDNTAQPFVDLALAIAARLRGVQRFDLALRIVTLPGTTSPRLRLEHALAAYGARDDCQLAELTNEDPALAQLFAPCLAATRGDAIPKAPTGGTPLVKGIYGICRAAQAIASKKPAQVRTAVKGIPANQSVALRATLWTHLARALTSAKESEALDAAQTLLTLEPIKSQRPLQASLGWELGRKHPDAFGESSTESEYELGAEICRSGRRANLATVGDPVARLRQFLAQNDLHELPESARAAAAIYQGYFLLASEPQQAIAAFDRAIALGADLSETLRGRWLATQTRTADRLHTHLRVDPLGEKAAERLTHLLERQPDGHSLRALLLVELGMLQTHRQDLQALSQTANALRAMVETHGYDDEPLLFALRAFEISTLGKSNPAKALELAEPLLHQGNRQPGLWELTISMLRRVGRHADAEALVLRAAALSIAPEFVAQAKRLHRERRLANVPPEAVTAGLLANEVRIRFEELEENPELETVNRLLDAQDLVEAQTRLTPEAKTAFEAAAISLVAAYTDENTWLVLAMQYLLAALASNRNATWIGAAALFAVDDERDLVRFGKALAAAEVPPKLVEALAYFVADNVHAPAAKRFIVAISAKLEAGAASRVLREVKRNSAPPGDGRQLSVIHDIDKLLAPEFELLAPIDEDEFDEDEFDEDSDDFDDDAFDVGPAHFQGPPVKELRKALLTIGLPKAKVERLTSSQLEQLMALLMQSLAQAPTQAAFNRLERAFMKFGFAPGDLDGLRNGTARPGRAKGLDTCPF